LPGFPAAPLDEFVERLHRQIAHFAAEAGVERAYVVVELVDGWRVTLDSLSPEPGFGFVTLHLHTEVDEDVPERVVVAVGSIKRIELDRAQEERKQLGFSAPAEAA
jgi:hypothetical protein